MKATLSFTLPEDEGEFQNAINGGKYAAVIDDIKMAFRDKDKYSPIQETTWAEVRELLYSVLRGSLED